MTKIFFKFVYVNITISLYWAVYLICSQWSEYSIIICDYSLVKFRYLKARGY